VGEVIGVFPGIESMDKSMMLKRRDERGQRGKSSGAAWDQFDEGGEMMGTVNSSTLSGFTFGATAETGVGGGRQGLSVSTGDYSSAQRLFQGQGQGQGHRSSRPSTIPILNMSELEIGERDDEEEETAGKEEEATFGTLTMSLPSPLHHSIQTGEYTSAVRLFQPSQHQHHHPQRQPQHQQHHLSTTTSLSSSLSSSLTSSHHSHSHYMNSTQASRNNSIFPTTAAPMSAGVGVGVGQSVTVSSTSGGALTNASGSGATVMGTGVYNTAAMMFRH
jgi:hypothetical protein